jgi:dTMP kinase
MLGVANHVFNRVIMQGSVSTGTFISIEGGEGVGKSSFSASLVAALSRTSREVVATREPGGTLIANSIRAIFANPPAAEPLTPQAEAMLVLAARAQHVANLIRPALARGAWVVCDRYSDSTMVYQGKLAGLDPAWLRLTNRIATGGLEPDLTFLLDCPVEISRRRCEGRLKSGRQEDGAARYDGGTAGQHEIIRAGFLECAASAPSRFVVLDSSTTVETVIAKALKTLHERFPGDFSGAGGSRG